MKYICLFIITLFLSHTLTAQQVKGWRGINRDGVYHETGLLKEWPAGGPEHLWTVTGIGKGYSSPVVSGNKIFVTGMNEAEDREILTVFTTAGEKLYQVEYGSPWLPSYPDTRTTPTVYGDRVYVASGVGEVACLDAGNGQLHWQVEGEKQFGKTAGKWGTAESLLLVDDKVIFTPGGEQTSMVALDYQTGETVWRTQALGDTCSHVSPLLIRHNGIDQIIGFTRNHMFGVDPSTGEMKWAFSDWNFKPTYGNDLDGICINTPLYRDGRLFVSNAYGMQSYMFELTPGATGVNLLWRSDALSVHTGGMVLYDGVIYGSNWFNNNSGDWIALDWNTGELRYKTSWPGGRSKGSVIVADDMLYGL